MFTAHTEVAVKCCCYYCCIITLFTRLLVCSSGFVSAATAVRSWANSTSILYGLNKDKLKCKPSFYQTSIKRTYIHSIEYSIRVRWRRRRRRINEDRLRWVFTKSIEANDFSLHSCAVRSVVSVYLQQACCQFVSRERERARKREKWLVVKFIWFYKTTYTNTICSSVVPS